jgi:hypothetical protein
MNNFDIISETSYGVVSYCELQKQYQLAYKNMIVLMPTVDECQKINLFFQNMKQSCCGKHSHLSKKYVFGINGTSTFFAFDEEEMNELKELLAHAYFQIQIKELLNNN